MSVGERVENYTGKEAIGNWTKQLYMYTDKNFPIGVSTQNK